MDESADVLRLSWVMERFPVSLLVLISFFRDGSRILDKNFDI